MRVLHLIPTLAAEYGGPTHALPGMVRASRSRGDSVDVAYLRTENGAIGSPVPLPAGDVGVLQFERSLPKRFGNSHALLAWLREHVRRYDLVHIHGIFTIALLRAARICHDSGIPYVVRPHGSLDPYDLQKKWLLKRLLGPVVIRPFLQRAAVVHCTSPQEAARLTTYGAVVPVVVSPLAVTSEAANGADGKLPRIRQSFAVPPDSLLVLGLSRFHPKKRFELLIDAVDALARRGRPIHLILAGSGDTSYESALRQRAAQLIAVGRVSFAGFAYGGRKEALLRQADVMVLPSDDENYGFAVIEAMQRGLPVIVSPGVHLGQRIQAAGAGRVCPQDAEALAAELEEFVHDRAHGGRLLHEMGQRARELAEGPLGEAACQQSLLRMYDDIVGGAVPSLDAQ